VPSLRTLLKISRPGLWFQTLWLYALPLAAGADWSQPGPYLGLLYVTYPLNALVYGWNDLVDVDIDAQNPRKDSWLFGARATAQDLRFSLRLNAVLQVIFAALFTILSGPSALLLMAGIVAVNATYNARIGGLRGRPPFDLINPLGYLLVVQLAVQVAGVPAVPWQALVYLALFCLQAQLIGEVMDYWPDLASGRVTSATRLGVRPSKLIITGVVAIEAALLWFAFADWLLASMLAFGTLWLLADLLILWRDRQYTRHEYTLAGLGMNAAGLISMAWVFYTGSLLRPIWP
jgi:4-hydroxybenzoate polyprenyltransferase